MEEKIIIDFSQIKLTWDVKPANEMVIDNKTNWKTINLTTPEISFDCYLLQIL